MNTTNLIYDVSKKTGYSKAVAQEIISAAMEAIQSQVNKGIKVRLVGFGTFEAVLRSGRVGRNPMNGQPVEIPPMRQPKFRSSGKWKEALNRRRGKKSA